MVALFVPHKSMDTLFFPRCCEVALEQVYRGRYLELREQFKFKREGGPKTIPLTIAAEPNIFVARVQASTQTYPYLLRSLAHQHRLLSSLLFFFLLSFSFLAISVSGSETLCS
jgi:hypothetical protein